MSAHLAQAAHQFFGGLANLPEAPIRRYAVVLALVTPEGVIEIPLCRDVEGPIWPLDLIGEAQDFEGLVAGRLTLGQALYGNRVRIRDEKAKHNLSVALGVSIRMLQEQLREARGSP